MENFFSVSRETKNKLSVVLYMTFVAVNNTFDTVSRDGLWKSKANVGCPHNQIHSTGAEMSLCYSGGTCLE